MEAAIEAPKKKIDICIVTRGTPDIEFSVHLFEKFIPSLPANCEARLHIVKPKADLVKGRNVAARAAAEGDSDYTIFLDDDIYPVLFDFHLALGAIESGGVVAFDYERRDKLGGVAACLSINVPYHSLSRVSVSKVEKVYVCGAGFIVAHTAAIRKVLEAEGCWSFAGNIGDHYLADDYSSFWLMKKHGVPYCVHPHRVDHRPI